MALSSVGLKTGIKMAGSGRISIRKHNQDIKIIRLCLHPNSHIFPIDSDADADGFPFMDSNANAGFGKIMNSHSDSDCEKLAIHSMTNADSSLDSPSLEF